jgi:predicted protein tyrosine phosphatase
MPAIAVCSLARLGDTVAELGASHIVTLINPDTPVLRPHSVTPERHLFIGVSDIVEPLDGHILPDDAHVDALLGFVRSWERRAPLVIHCYAGISRSTAAAFITACTLQPERSETSVAHAIRVASPTATPNARLVQLADDMLGRRGRMVDAVTGIGVGRAAYEGVPFVLPVV